MANVLRTLQYSDSETVLYALSMSTANRNREVLPETTSGPVKDCVLYFFSHLLHIFPFVIILRENKQYVGCRECGIQEKFSDSCILPGEIQYSCLSCTCGNSLLCLPLVRVRLYLRFSNRCQYKNFFYVRGRLVNNTTQFSFFPYCFLICFQKIGNLMARSHKI